VGTAKVIGGAIYTLPYPFVITKMMGAALAPDNTIEGLKICMSTPVDAIECDAHILTDKSLGVMHNSNLSDLTTSSGNTDDMTAPSWQNLVIKVTGSGGGDGIGIYAIKGSTDDAWGGIYHPPLLPDVMNCINGKKVLFVDYKNNGALNPLMALITRMGMKDSIIINDSVDDGTQLAPAIAAGFTCNVGWAGTIGDPDIAVQFAALKALGLKFVYLLYPTQTTKTVIDLAHAAGLRVLTGSMNRYSDWKGISDLAPTLGVEGVFSVEPYYSLGFMQGNYDYRKTTDPFKANSWYHGMPGGGTGTDRGYFTSGRFGFKQESATRSMTLQGWGCPISTPIAYTIDMSIKFDQVDTDGSRGALVFFGAPTDRAALGDAEPSQGESGYLLAIRANGAVDFYRYDAGVITSLGFLSGTAIITGTTITITLQVTSTQIIYTRTDTTPDETKTVTDNTYRGPYFFFGHSQGIASEDHNKVSFSDVTIS
jgi:glycerophosphoryl diester phosphodiesterase